MPSKGKEEKIEETNLDNAKENSTKEKRGENEKKKNPLTRRTMRRSSRVKIRRFFKQKFLQKRVNFGKKEKSDNSSDKLTQGGSRWHKLKLLALAHG